MPSIAVRPGRRLRRGAQALLLGCALLALDETAAAAALDTEGAFGGWARPGRQSELVVTLSAARTGDTSLEIRDGVRAITTRAHLEAGVSRVLRVPVTASTAVSVRAQLPGSEFSERDYSFRLAESPLIAWAAGRAPPEVREGAVAVPVAAGTLPYSAAGYSGIDALVVDEDTLAHLEPDQAHALLAFLGDCGRTVALAVSAATADALRAASGCGGRGYSAEASAESAQAVLDRLLTLPLPEPVAFDSLRAIVDAGAGAWPVIAAGITVYLAALAALLIARARLTLVLGWAMLGTVCAAFLPGLGRSAPALAVWAEAEASASVARYAARLEWAGSYPGTRTLALDPLLRGPQPCAEGGQRADQWIWDADQRRYTGLRTSLPLFGDARVCFRGDFPVAVRAAQIGAGRAPITLTNSGATAWGAGSAFVSGRLYRLTALEPGQSQVLETGSGTAPRSAAEELLAARDLSPVLLWPLPLPEIASAGRARAWLAVQVAPAVDGR